MISLAKIQILFLYHREIIGVYLWFHFYNIDFCQRYIVNEHLYDAQRVKGLLKLPRGNVLEDNVRRY
jgi:hypothetical protein